MNFFQPQYQSTGSNQPAADRPDSLWLVSADHADGGGASLDQTRPQPEASVGVRSWPGQMGLAMRRLLRLWPFEGRGAALRQRVQAVAQHQPVLRTHSAEVESAFVELGRMLQEQTRLATELGEQSRRGNVLAEEGEGENAVRATVRLIDKSLDGLERIRNDCGGLVERLRSEYDAVGRLQNSGAYLERAIAPLRIVDTLFRIEAASLPTEMQAAFSALTHDIGELDRRVRETFSHHFDALAAIRDAMGEVVADFATQRAERDRIAAEQRAIVRKSLQSLDATIRTLHSREERIGGIAGKVEQASNAIVVAVQYQDITRQKLEHVMAGIDSLVEHASRPRNGSVVAFVRHASLLEATQLAAVEDNLQGAVDDIDRGVAQIRQALGEIEAECSAGLNGNWEAATVAATIEALLGLLDALKAPLEHAGTTAEAATQAIKSFGGLSSDLGDTIRELTWGIRLIALNAQVQAAQVERCDGLEVLSQHTYVVSEETSRVAASFSRELTALADRLNAVVTLVGALSTQAGLVRAEFEHDCGHLAAALKAKRNTAADAAQRLASLVQEARRHTSRICAGAGLAAIDREPLGRAEDELRRLSDWCASRDSTGSHQGEDGAAELAVVKRKYTMESERQVHTAVLGLDSAQSQTCEAAAGEEAPLAGARPLGANVELF